MLLILLIINITVADILHTKVDFKIRQKVYVSWFYKSTQIRPLTIYLNVKLVNIRLIFGLFLKKLECP
jgi:hypothetical protein